MRYFFVVLTGLVFSAGLLSAQPLRFQYTYVNSKALPFDMSGYDMQQDSAGIIYWCSVDGVYSFDGFRVQLFHMDNSRFREPQPQYVTSLYIDRADVVWAGLRNGLARLNRTTGELDPIALSATKTADIAFRILEDSRGNIWADTYDGNPANGNATRYNRQTGKATPYFIRFADGKPMTARIESIYEDELGFRAITAESSYVIRPIARDTGIAEPLQWPGGPKNSHLENLLAKDGLGNYWATDTTGRLFYGKSLAELRLFNTIPEVNKWLNPGIYIDRKNRAWITGPKIAVYNPATGTYQFIEPKTCENDGFTGEYIHHIFHDRQNVHWVMSGRRTGGGVVHLLTEQPDKFGTWKATEKPCNIFPIYREPGNGDLWLGTYENGVYHLDRKLKLLDHFTADTGLPDQRLSSNKVIFLTPAGKNEIWFNCVPDGISIWNKKTKKITTLKTPDGLKYQECFLLNDGKVFLAAYHQSCIYDPATGIFTPNPPIPIGTIGDHAFRFIQDIEEDGNDIWMGGYDKKVHRLNRLNGTLTTIDTTFLKHNVMSIHRRGDSLYIGTLGQGLVIYDIPKGKFVANFMTPEGFPHQTVYGVAEDRKKRLWLFSSNGLTMFEPEKRLFTEFAPINGLPWEGFTSGSYFQDENGIMYGGGEGLLWFNPDSLASSIPQYAAHIHITGFLLAGKNQLALPGQTIRLAPDENYFEIRFSNLDYGFPRIDSFWYQLDGYDDDWHLVTEPIAFFSRIPPGDYLFRVRGTNRFGIKSNIEATLVIHISPWWWQSLWFKILVLLSVAVGGYYAWHAYTLRKATRERDLQVQMQLKSLEALRSQLNHHFVKNALGRANAKVLNDDVKEANLFLGQFARLMEMVLLGTKNDFYTLREEAAIMRMYLDIQRKRWREVFETDFFMEPALEEGDFYCPSLLMQPLAENAIEHGLLPKSTLPRRLSIRWNRSGNNLLCTVEDTGIGIQPIVESPEADASHIGLENVRSRIKIINVLYHFDIKLTVGETPGGGVSITIFLPLISKPPSLHPSQTKTI